MRIGCWNVNSLRVRLEFVKKWLIQEQIDIALLQETKIPDDLFPQSDLKDLGYEAVFWGQKGHNGVAILSHWPLTDVKKQDFLGNTQARYLEAVTQGIRIVCVYVPNGKALDNPAYQDKLLFIQRLAAHVAPYRYELRTTLIGGDFNVALNDEDVHDPQRWMGHLLFSEPERKALRTFLFQGWTDSIVTHQKQKNPFTWWNYQGKAWQRDAGLRIDYFMLSPWGADHLKDAGVFAHYRGEPGPSDHAPIWVEIKTS